MELRRVWTALATGGYISYIPTKLFGGRKWTGAGALGTAEGLALLPLLPREPWAYALFLAAATAAAAWICGRAETALGVHDDPRIVLDEVVGFWAAAAWLPLAAAPLAAAFALFRAFDAFKPGPIAALERLPGGWGTVADDIGAGLCANLTTRLLIAWMPALFAGAP